MPGMTGPELVRELRRLQPALPVILMSGYGGPDLQAQAQSAGAQAVLMKPLAAAELAACLASVLAEVRGRTKPGCPAIPGTRPDFSAPG
jgi:CheY-like chemotaxis protein